jgi:beta-galactosidase
MSKISSLCLCALVVLTWTASSDARETQSFDAHWQFHLGDIDSASEDGFDDSSWRTLDLPHDWSIELPFDQHAPAGGAGAFIPTGVGWYRKHFTIPSSDANKKIFVEFDGVTSNADVYINGKHLGHRPYFGFSFSYDLTPHLNFGDKENVLAVRVDNSKQPASRWYTGSGINRHVRLAIADPIHFGSSSLFVSAPEVTDARAKIHFDADVINDDVTTRPVQVAFAIFDRSGKVVAAKDTEVRNISAAENAHFSGDVDLPAPHRWDIADPFRYIATVTANVGKVDSDTVATRFGIREFHFDPDTGFWLNGKNFKLKGVCVHEDLSALGTAVPMGAWRQRLLALRELGVNAIRTAHNPPAPQFLDLCDQMGFLVMDEMFDCWTVAKTPYDYHLYFRDNYLKDTRDTVRRDRNHPCVILWSAGNEIHDTPHAEIAKPILEALVKDFHENDPTRPVTQALFRPNVSHDYEDGLADLLDVVGQNYRENEILAAHAQKPSRKIVGTENGHDRKIWLACRDHPEYSGQFLWTGLDYLGESREWPIISSTSGLIDRIGFPRVMGYERQSWWSDKPMVFMTRRVPPPSRERENLGGFEPLRRPQVLFADWTPTDLAPHEETVEVYSNCPGVELFLNDQSLGTKERAADESPRVWKVWFAPGVLRAVGNDKDKIVASHELKTAGPAAKILLTSNASAISPTWDDVALVTATVVDEHDVPVPMASNEITFTAGGSGFVYAVDNADPRSHESFRGKVRHAYQSRCQAVVKATAESGDITLSATSPNLAEAKVVIHAVKESK